MVTNEDKKNKMIFGFSKNIKQKKVDAQKQRAQMIKIKHKHEKQSQTGCGQTMTSENVHMSHHDD